MVQVDLGAAKMRWDGLGGLSSGGRSTPPNRFYPSACALRSYGACVHYSTRLLADYPEQQRSDFLDLLFAKKGDKPSHRFLLSLLYEIPSEEMCRSICPCFLSNTQQFPMA